MSIAWIKVGNEWKLVDALAKTNGQWAHTNPTIKTPGGWEGASWSTNTPGGFTERYLHKINNLFNEIIAPETNPELQYPGLTYVNPRPYIPGSTPMSPPLFMNGLHLALIPKGPHRGKVLAMNGNVVLASSVSYFGSSDVWSFQCASILDFSEDAGTPEKPRFLNFIIPIGTSSIVFNESTTPAFEDQAYPNFFCVGQAWTPSGDLTLVGGSQWGFNRAPERQIYGEGTLYASYSTWAWNPALPGSWTSSVQGYYTYTSQQIPFTSGHYVSAGCWRRGPLIQEYRWYTTVLPYPRSSRYANNPSMLALGGESLKRTGFGFDRIPSTFNSYEALIIGSMTTSSNSGLYRDSFQGGIFPGPSLENPQQIYSALYADRGYTLDLDNSVFNDSLYFYPRAFTTSSNGVSYAGFTHRSALLTNHGTSPGVWDLTVGNDVTSNTARDKFRYYGSAFRVPNNLEQHKVDDIVRCGGGNIFDYDRELQDTVDVDILKLSDITGTVGPGINNYIQWSGYGSMAEPRSTFNTVILPDASVFAVGGVRNNTQTSLQLKQSFVEEVSGFYNQVEITPLVLADHHHQSGPPNAELTFEDATHHHIEHLIEDVYDVFPAESLAEPATNTDGLFYFSIYPEILGADRQEWTLYDWARSTSWRDYHSASILLPDGRVLISGGEGRHSQADPWIQNADNTIIPGLGVDYEIFSPKYIKPTQGPNDTTVRPTGVGISGAPYNSDPQIDCPQFSYSGQYIVSSNSLGAGVYLEKVVLMAPGNCTHHADHTQRYYMCVSQQISATQLGFTLPTGENILPRGFYMLFAVTNEEIPAEAVWVWVN